MYRCARAVFASSFLCPCRAQGEGGGVGWLDVEHACVCVCRWCRDCKTHKLRCEKQPAQPWLSSSGYVARIWPFNCRPTLRPGLVIRSLRRAGSGGRGGGQRARMPRTKSTRLSSRQPYSAGTRVPFLSTVCECKGECCVNCHARTQKPSECVLTQGNLCASGVLGLAALVGAYPYGT